MKTSKPLSSALKDMKRVYEASQKKLQASYKKEIENKKLQLAKELEIKKMQLTKEQKMLKMSQKKLKAKLYKQNRKRPAVADNAKANDISYGLFAKALEKIGKPSDTQTVAEKIRLTNANARSLAKRNPKRFMQLMYSSASYLVEQGVLSRKKLGHNYFEYALESWNKKPAKRIVKKSNKVAA